MICSVIITAFKNTKYILESIESIAAQTLPDGWEVRYYIGVDACKETSDYLIQNKIPHYWTNTNVGTYILSNSLFNQAKNDGSDIYVRFDSDDVALQNFLLYGIENTQKYHFFRPYSIKCDINLNPIGNIVRASGSAFFDSYALNALGGYQHYRVACDTDMYKRAINFGFIEEEVDEKPAYYYRQHPSSLMNTTETAKRSQLRVRSWKEMSASRNSGLIKIDYPMITDLTYVR